MKSGLCVLLLVMLLPGVVSAESAGEKLFNRKCAMCHIVHGRGGAIGPDLSKVGSRLSNAQLQAKIAYPKKSNPASFMPSFATLPSADMQALVGFLKTLR